MVDLRKCLRFAAGGGPRLQRFKLTSSVPYC